MSGKQSELSLIHSHTFGQDQKRTGEARTVVVIIITGAMMVVEITTGILFGSIALLADGLHMASHASALTINLIAYIYARKHAGSQNFSFGTGKVNALGGFSGAVLLAVFTLIMVQESIDRFINPVQISFNQAILVAVLGLIVNGISALILQEHSNHDGELHHGGQSHTHSQPKEREDHNLRSAYLHVLADALTSLTAIFGLLAGKYFGWIWMDPLMGLIGAGLVLRWSVGLLRSTSRVLLDRQGPENIERSIRAGIKKMPDTTITDLHLWSIGPGIYSLIISLAARHPLRPEEYKKLIPEETGISHITIEVHQADHQ